MLTTFSCVAVEIEMRSGIYFGVYTSPSFSEVDGCSTVDFKGILKTCSDILLKPVQTPRHHFFFSCLFCFFVSTKGGNKSLGINGTLLVFKCSGCGCTNGQHEPPVINRVALLFKRRDLQIYSTC